jgi:hypothetical protein
MVQSQQTYMDYLGRVNTITYSAIPNTLTDGFQQKNGRVVSYVVYPTNEVDPSSEFAMDTFVELENDVIKIKESIDAFNEVVETEQEFTYLGKKYRGTLVLPLPYKLPENEEVFIPFSDDILFDDFSFRRTYMILSDDVTDSKKYETFKDAVIGNIIKNEAFGSGRDNISAVFDAYWNVIAKPVFTEENNITKEFVNYMELNKLKDYLKFTPFNLKKKRTFEYTTENANTDEQKDLIKGLGWIENQNTKNKNWNDERPTNVFISKAKLN